MYARLMHLENEPNIAALLDELSALGSVPVGVASTT
jgi:hypothetical protein